MEKKILIVLFIISACFCGCNNEDLIVEQLSMKNQELDEYVKSTDPDAKYSPFGFYYKKLENSLITQKAADNTIVSISYQLTIIDNNQTYLSTNEPVKFKVAYGNIVPLGLYDAIKLMEIGSKYVFYLPASLAYNKFSNDQIPEFANIKITVTLHEMQAEADTYYSLYSELYYYADSTYKSINKGTYLKYLKKNHNTPVTFGKNVTFYYQNFYLNNTKINSDTTKIFFTENILPKGLEKTLPSIRKDEEVELLLSPDYGFGNGVQIIPDEIRNQYFKHDPSYVGIPPYTNIKSRIRILNVN